MEDSQERDLPPPPPPPPHTQTHTKDNEEGKRKVKEFQMNQKIYSRHKSMGYAICI